MLTYNQLIRVKAALKKATGVSGRLLVKAQKGLRITARDIVELKRVSKTATGAKAILIAGITKNRRSIKASANSATLESLLTHASQLQTRAQLIATLYSKARKSANDEVAEEVVEADDECEAPVSAKRKRALKFRKRANEEEVVESDLNVVEDASDLVDAEDESLDDLVDAEDEVEEVVEAKRKKALRKKANDDVILEDEILDATDDVLDAEDEVEEVVEADDVSLDDLVDAEDEVEEVVEAKRKKAVKAARKASTSCVSASTSYGNLESMWTFGRH